MQSSVNPCPLGQGEGSLFDAGLVPIEDAAAALNLDVKRLRGYVWRNGLGDPIGSLATDHVYGWSCRYLAAASTSSLRAIPGQAQPDEAGAAVK